MRKRKALLAFMFFAFVGLLAQPASAGGILILPIRVVFSGHDRSKSITVMNTGQKPATFRMSLFYQKQTKNGGYKKIDKPLVPGVDLKKMLVYSPRQIYIQPNGSQLVRVYFRRPPNLPDGEYRIHMRLKRLSGGQKLAPVKHGKIQTEMTINIGFAIPIIIRQGKDNTTASISDVKLLPASAEKHTPPKLTFHLNRKGKFSTLGKVEVYWTPTGGKEQKVGILNDVNVFPELNERDVDLDLSQNITDGKMRIVYEGDAADKGKTFDTKIINIK